MKKVKVQYKKLPSILSIEEAIEQSSYFMPAHGQHYALEAGLPFDEAILSEDVVIVEGEQYIGGQEHWYLEANACVATPTDDGGMKIVSSTQNPTKTQQSVAAVLALSANQVVSSVVRCGGGFGGKELKPASVAAACAVAAHKLKKPVKIVLDRQTDIAMSGQRHPVLVKYKAAAKKSDGSFVAAEMDLYFQAGYSWDLSEAVCQQALLKTANAYHFPNFKCRGFICKTTTTSNTAFRAFGGPQAMMACETVVDHLANALKMESSKVRYENLYAKGATTFFGQVLDPWVNLKRLWDSCASSSNFYERQKDVEEFNAKHKYRKRGISMLPVKFGSSFVLRLLEQGGALIHVYTDGSVLVSHGGVEIGQGLHTKIKQAVARCFDIDLKKVRMDETSTDKASANSVPTAASMAQELFAMAAVDAATQIVQRLFPLKKMLPATASFADLVAFAWVKRVPLSAYGFYKTKTVCEKFDWTLNLKPGESNAKRGTPYNYFTCGVGCSEIELDVLTGDIRTLRSDITMDMGSVINPALDVGQIEGAYLQGYGMYMLEDLKLSPKNGAIVTDSAAKYKIPTADDAPLDFRVCLIDKDPTCADLPSFPIHSSRAIGEPPYFLAASAYFAARNAIHAARDTHAAAGKNFIRTDTPLTPEQARMAIQDLYLSPEANHYGLAN